MPADYGYIRGTTGADGDHVDCFIGPDDKSDKVVVIDQKDLKTGKFDESKVMLGLKNREAAIGGYCNSFSDGNGVKRIMKITPMSVDEFKEWIKNDATLEPLKESA
jgi:Inorganic Pyrophosphatase